MAQNAIELENVQKTYAKAGDGQQVYALDKITLNIPSGSIFGLLGPNGAGKSTLINILAGLVIKTSGKVKIWGFDQDINPRQSRAAIGIMPQELNMDPFFTPRASLEVQAGLYGVPRRLRRTDEILQMIGLSDKAGAYARTLSGGMRRRLLLGKAMVHSPQILVLDEPTAGVDLGLRQSLWENIRHLNTMGTTVILTTHHLEEAQEMCGEIAILNKGKIRAQDTTENLLARLDRKTMIVQGRFPTEKIELPQGVKQQKRAEGIFAFSYHRNLIPAEAILDALRTGQVSINDIRTEEADLEDVFMALTG